MPPAGGRWRRPPARVGYRPRVTNAALRDNLVTIQPGGTSGPENYTHEGEDAGVVLKGALELWVDGQRFNLEEGDGFRFKSSLPHHFTNPTEQTTEAIWVLSPPTWGKADRTHQVGEPSC